MEKKIKTLRVILMIGTIVLLIAGLSFLFVGSVQEWVRTITMFLISGVFLFLSIYEEFILKFKKDSIVTYIFSNISAWLVYICITAYALLGEWFTLDGDGAFIYIAGFFALVALQILIASVKYKLYKLIELSIWLILISIAFILKFFEMDGIYIYTMIIAVVLIKNLIKTSSYSKWATFAILLFGIGFCGVEDHEIMTIIVGILMLLNMLAVFYRGKGFKAPFVILMTIYLPIMAHTCFTPFTGLLTVVFLDLLLVGTKVFKKDGEITPSYVMLKIFMQIAYFATIVFSNIEGPFLFIVPTIVFLTSVISSTLLKDEGEKYILPIKLFYFAYAIVYNLPFSSIKTTVALFIANMFVLLLYLLNDKKGYRIMNIVLMVFINLLALFFDYDSTIATIFNSLIFLLDFYIVYVREEEAKIPLTFLFIIHGVLSLTFKFGMANYTLIVIALVYLVFLCITIKNKVLFTASLFGFVLAISGYLNYLIPDSLYVKLFINIIVFGAIVLYKFVCIKVEKSRAVFFGIATSIHIAILLFTPNVLLKVLALVEAIILIAFSMKNDDHKLLFDFGIVGVVVSLLFILGSFESLPKSLYLIIVAMTIIIIVPIIITRVIIKQRKEALLNPVKEEIKEEKKAEKKEEVKPNRQTKKKADTKFCSECGSELLPNSAFCSNCGVKIK